MSRAGKFIPGGKGGDPANRTGPIRAPSPGNLPTESVKKTAPAKGSGLIRPVSKGQRLPILIMSSLVCCLLVSVAWYEFAVLPAKRAAVINQQLRDDAIAAQKQAQEDLAKLKADDLVKKSAERATLTISSDTPGAFFSIGDERKTSPAVFDDLLPGKVTVSIHAEGYEDAKQDATVAVDHPADLGMISLVPKTGNLSISSPQSDVQYSVTGPAGYSHDGNVPAVLTKLPIGDYQVTVWQHDWRLLPVTVSIHDQETVDKEMKFPYSNVTIASVPAGATVRQDHTIIGKTPYTFSNLRAPSDLNVSVDLAPYDIERFAVHVTEGANVTKTVPLQQGKNFVAACGIPMVWIPDGDFWAGKYLVRQIDFETIAGYNPSSFRRPNRPVEQVSWEAAMAFCDKLNAYEKARGKLPAGYHYTLPTESQWSAFSADADINQAPMSRNSALTSTQDVGASEPNKYGLYDTLGNVWEWCSDNFDDKGNHSLRGGNWLSSEANFPSGDTRQGAGPKYSDRFTGFRVVLVPN